MSIKKSAQPTKIKRKVNDVYSTISIAKYPVLCNAIPLKNKPEKGSKELTMTVSKIHKDLKKLNAEQLTIEEILERFTSGYAMKLGEYKLQDFTANELRELREAQREDYQEAHRLEVQYKAKKQLELVSTDLLVLDIDDDIGAVDPLEVFNYIGATAMYYTFSHRKISKLKTPQNAYRLLFRLSEPVTSKELLKHIQQALKDHLEKAFPALQPTPYKNGTTGGIDVIGDNFIFGTNHTKTAIDHQATPIDVATYKKEWQAEKALRSYTSSRGLEDLQRNSTNDKEALEMAQFIGDLNGSLSFDEWLTVAIGIFNSAQAGQLEEETAIEVLKIIDGNQHEDSFYLTYKRPLDDSRSTATIASFIKLATDRGFKRSFTDKYASIDPIQAPAIPTENIQIKEYVQDIDIMKILEDSAKRTLFVSDTNTGKTYATISASKKHLQRNSDCFVYVASPSRALASQISSKYKLGEPLQDNQQAHKLIKQAIYNDKRMIVGTYDKAPHVLRALSADYNLIIIADEAHKEVTDFNFRYKAINNLFNIAKNEQVVKFIGLTGTPQEIDLTHYDKQYIVKQEQPKKVANQLCFIEYHKSKHYQNMITRAIMQEVRAGSKVLAFVNNKGQIETVRKSLKKVDIKAVAVTADNRKSKTYNALLTTEKIPENVDVVLATSAIADGINIKNESDFVCIVAPHYREARFFNTSLIKQASHRFRKTYKKLLLPVFIKHDLEKERKQTTPYNLEQQYNFLLKEAEHTKRVIEETFQGAIDLYKPSVAEALSGLFNTNLAKGFNFTRAYEEKENKRLELPYDSQLVETLEEIQERLLTVDKRAIRQQASYDKESYYAYFPYAFQKAVKDITGIEDVVRIESVDYVRGEDKEDRLTLLEELERLEQLQSAQQEEKRQKVTETLTETVYEDITQQYYQKERINEESKTWQALKKGLANDHYIALKSLVPFLTHNQAIQELQRIKKRAQTHELKKSLQGYLELQEFKPSEEAGKKNKTQVILEQLKDALGAGNTYTATERDELIQSVAKRFRGAKNKEAVQKIFSQFYVQSEQKQKKINGRNTKVSQLQLVNISYIANKHNFTEREVKSMLEKLEYNRKMK